MERCYVLMGAEGIPSGRRQLEEVRVAWFSRRCSVRWPSSGFSRRCSVHWSRSGFRPTLPDAVTEFEVGRLCLMRWLAGHPPTYSS